MKTIKLVLPWTIKNIAAALGEPVSEILKKLTAMGAPESLTENTTLDPDIAKVVALKFCCYLEIDDENDGRKSS